MAGDVEGGGPSAAKDVGGGGRASTSGCGMLRPSLGTFRSQDEAEPAEPRPKGWRRCQSPTPDPGGGRLGGSQ